MEILRGDQSEEAPSDLIAEIKSKLKARQKAGKRRAEHEKEEMQTTLGVSHELNRVLEARQNRINKAAAKEERKIHVVSQRKVDSSEKSESQEQVARIPSGGGKSLLGATIPRGEGASESSSARKQSCDAALKLSPSLQSNLEIARPTIFNLEEEQRDKVTTAVLQVLGVLCPSATVAVAVMVPSAAAAAAGEFPKVLSAEQRREHQCNATGADSPNCTILEVGDQIWVPCSREVWREAVVTGIENDFSGGMLHVEVGSDKDSREREEIPLRSLKFHTRNDGLLSIADTRAVQDLSSLSILHEPAVLRALQLRFDDGIVYTSCGPVLLAVNPFRVIPRLYDDQQLQAFAELQVGQKAPLPHIFDVARAAYEGVWHEAASQTVLVSGESGAGKTETTKFVMRFLASISHRRADTVKMSATENQVLQSNPLLESLGNAKTVRNDNSSRFGKFMEIKFIPPREAECPKLAGAEMRTYLLEKSRVVGAQKGERNFHIFYQFLAALADAQSAEPSEGNAFCRHLLQCLMDCDACQGQDSFRPKDFAYLAQSKTKRISGVDEVADFYRTLEAMRAFRILDAELCDIFLVIIAVLHLGNLAFRAPAGKSESSEVMRPDGDCEKTTKGKARGGKHLCALARTSRFVGVSSEALEAAFCTHAMKVGNSTIVQHRNVAQAEAGRDALARHLYGLIFNFVVQRVNSVLRESNQESGEEESLPFVGILDIFGFELFEYNSLEQLCVNFTNELLQQYFNEVIFKHEAMLYEDEHVLWDIQEFPDNTAIVSLLSGGGKSLLSGVFPTLDEECRIASGTPESWCNKLGVQYRTSKIFKIVLIRKENFVVEHFAGPVEYNSKDFLTKNRDQLSEDILQCMQGSSKAFVSELFVEHGRKFGVTTSREDGRPAPRRVKAYSVSSEFRQQLQALMQRIRATTPHFVRCLKPNPESAAHVFNRCSVAEQLRCQGVLEAIRVSRAGYPLRLRHREGVLKYRQLADKELRQTIASEMEGGSTEDAAHALFEGLKSILPGIGTHTIQVGLTLIFFKRDAAEILDSALKQTAQESSVRIQACWRRRQCVCRYAVTQVAVVLSQAAARGMFGRRVAKKKRALRAAVRLQSAVRGHRCRLKCQESLRAVRVLQAWTRAKLQHAWYLKVRRVVICFQRWYRCNVQELIRGIGLRRRHMAGFFLQRYWRGALARRLCAVLRNRRRIAATRISRAWCRWVMERVMERSARCGLSPEGKAIDSHSVGDNAIFLQKCALYIGGGVQSIHQIGKLEKIDKFEKLGRRGELLAAMRCLRRSSCTLALEAAALARSCSELKHQVHSANLLRERYERSALIIQAQVRKFLLGPRRSRRCPSSSSLSWTPPSWNQVPPLAPEQLLAACTLTQRLAAKKRSLVRNRKGYQMLAAQSQSNMSQAMAEMISQRALPALKVLPRVAGKYWGWSSRCSLEEQASVLNRVLITYLSSVWSATSFGATDKSSFKSKHHSSRRNSFESASLEFSSPSDKSAWLPIHTEHDLAQMRRSNLRNHLAFLAHTVNNAGLEPPTRKDEVLPWILRIQTMRVQSLSLLASMCLGYSRGQEEEGFFLLTYLNDDVLEKGYSPWHESVTDSAGLLALIAHEAPHLTDALGKKLLQMVAAQLALCCILPAFVGFLADEPLLALWQQLWARHCKACPHFPLLIWLVGLLHYAEDDLVHFSNAQAFCCHLQQLALALPDGWRPRTGASEKQLLKIWWSAQSSSRAGA